MQNYLHCEYFDMYTKLMSQVDDASARQIRQELKKRMVGVLWLPAMQSDCIWSTRQMPQKYTTLLRGRGQPAPSIVINESVWQTGTRDIVLSEQRYRNDATDDGRRDRRASRIIRGALLSGGEMD